MGWHTDQIGQKITIDGYMVHVFYKNGSLHSSIDCYGHKIKAAYWRGDRVIVEFYDNYPAQSYQDSSWHGNA